MRCLIASLLISLSCLPARAEVAATSADSFEIRMQRQLAATPELSYRALGQVEHGRVIGDNTITALAGGVDDVLTQQIDRYAQFLATGKPAR